MNGLRVPGEYKRVSILCKFPTLLNEANRKKLAQDEVWQLVQEMREEFPVVGLKTVFTPRETRGKAGPGEEEGTMRISFPDETLIRAGLVLHEFAHVLKASQGISGTAHGPAFVRCLDAVLVWWFLRSE